MQDHRHRPGSRTRHIHRHTIKRLRGEIEPVSPADYMRFLFHWQGLSDKTEGPDGLSAIVDQLEGFSAAAGSWERDIIPARLDMYTSDLLDTLCSTGKSVWLRLAVRRSNGEIKKLAGQKCTDHNYRSAGSLVLA
ncbi:MAG: hypothetical protein HOI95_03510 [Chromatiales bacterium]|nr:hypothetical protein [Chromatiales bacterium]